MPYAHLEEIAKNLKSATVEMGELKQAVHEESEIRKGQNKWTKILLGLVFVVMMTMAVLFARVNQNSNKICEAVNDNRTTIGNILKAAQANAVPRTPPVNATEEQLAQFHKEEALRKAASDQFYEDIKDDLAAVSC